MKKFNRFIYDSWFFNPKNGVLELKYSFDKQIFFTETITFPVDQINTEVIESHAFKAAIESLWIMSGISYFKATLPPEISFKNYDLHPDQKTFFEKIFLHGLGEFFYVNNIDPRVKINFKQLPAGSQHPIPNKNIKTLCTTSLPEKKIPPTKKYLPTNAKILLPIGGGKDSLVSAKLLQKSGFNYTPWMVGETQIQHDCCTKLGKKPFIIERKICPKLIKLNKEGALNGHVPISAIWAFLSVVTAMLTNHTHVALSNEASANTENLEFKGLKINHQYSKSLKFEQDFQNYVDQFINSESESVHYFSLLRNLREIDIAKIFAEKCWTDFKDIFASCNRNFTITKKNLKTLPFRAEDLPKNERIESKKNYALASSTSATATQKKWCNTCPKCAFVFLVLAPFVDRAELIDVFGENLFIKPQLKNTFDELLGLTGHKPLECVGEIQECREALHGAKKNWPEVKQWIDIIETNLDL